MAKIKMGPILNFRGIDEKGAWRVGALVVYSGEAGSPKLSFSADDAEPKEVEGKRLKSFEGYEAWRFEWGVGQGNAERTVEYSLDAGPRYSYRVPAKGDYPRVAYASCAGFHSPEGKYAREKREDKNAMWAVLEREHKAKPYHLILMGGDQVYADDIWKEVTTLKEWARKPFKAQEEETLDDKTREKIAHFYFCDLYLTSWSEKEPAAVMRQVPSLMMWDDHDVFDGWGSKSGPLQGTKVYQDIYRTAREHFLLFQFQAAGEEDLPPGMLLVDDDRPGGGEPKNLSYAHRLGNDVAVAVLDMRSERTREQVMSPEAWTALRRWMREEIGGCKHLLLVSCIPLVYANLRMMESFLDLWPGEQDLEDDLKDHWHSPGHLDDRLALVNDLLDLGALKHCRTTILSGDVHVGALGHIEAEPDPQAPVYANSMVQLISSPIVNEPLPGMLALLLEAVLGSNVQDIDGENLDRNVKAELLPFPNAPRRQRLIRERNWLGIDWDESHRLHARWYAEGRESPFTKTVSPIGYPEEGGRGA